MRIRTGSAALLVVGSLLATPILTPVASAHSALVSVDPADGATVEKAPRKITLTFNEPINPDFSTLTLIDAEKKNHALGTPAVDGPRVSIEVSEAPPGPQTIGYRVTSADGHVVQGSSRFTVAGATAGGAASADNPASQAPTDRADESSGSGSEVALWVVAGLAVVLIGAAFMLVRRKN